MAQYTTQMNMFFPLAKIQKVCIFATASPTRLAPADSPRMGT